MAMMMMAVLGAKAQYDPGTWSMQIKFGFGASTMTNMESIPMNEGVSLDTQYAGASMYGLDVEYQATKWLGVSLGFNCSNQGTEWKDYTDADNIKYRDPQVSLSYLNVPLVANFYVLKGLALKAGVQAGFLTSADVSMRVKTVLAGHDVTTKTSVDVEDDCNKVDFSIPVGISYETKSHFVLGATYNIGVSKVNKNKIFGEKDNRNGMFMLNFGWKFDL